MTDQTGYEVKYGYDGAGRLATLREGLREQLARQVLWMCGLPPDTLFGYYDRVNFLEAWGGDGVRVKPLALIWRGVREYVHTGHLNEVLARFGDQPIVLHVDAPLRRFRFNRREQSILDVLRAKPQPLSELLGRGLADPAYVRRLVYAMIITRQLETGIQGVEPIGVDEARSLLVAARSRPAQAARAAERGRVRRPDADRLARRCARDARSVR